VHPVSTARKDVKSLNVLITKSAHSPNYQIRGAHISGRKTTTSITTLAPCSLHCSNCDSPILDARDKAGITSTRLICEPLFVLL
jgi:hypothetical protein